MAVPPAWASQPALRSVAGACLLALVAGPASWASAHDHGIAMHGAPKYEAGFERLDYVNPDAPKGGTIRHAVQGTFNSLNPFIIKGLPARGRHLTFESLMKRTRDEPFSLYGLIAESMEVPEDRGSVLFVLRPEARFHDGSEITVDDVVHSWRTLRDFGRPNHQLYYRQVERVERPGPRSVRFVFAAGQRDRELPLIMGLMPILSKSYYATVPFDETSLTPPLASGPYRVHRVDPGRSITYRRDPDYWGRHLPVNRGQYNFDHVRYDYYRDGNVMMEAFAAGEYDVRFETSEKRWANAYEFPAVADGRVKLAQLPHGRPSGMFGFVFNTRRPPFADRAVRQALAHAFDFAWVNETLMHGAYVRTQSVFANSPLASRGLPRGDELALLEPFRDSLPGEVFDETYRPPGGSGDLRTDLRAAQSILTAAGWTVRDGTLTQAGNGRPMAFEVLLVDSRNEKIALAFARNLARLGADVEVRTVDTPQYQYRLSTFDFDVIMYRWGVSLSPGNEQAYYWGSAAASQDGTRNYAGVQVPAVDALIERMTQERERESFVHTVRALDRVLLWGHWFVPLYHMNEDRIAYWDKFGRPDITPLYGIVTEAWWERDRVVTGGGARADGPRPP
jgi:microcin C transport system substrate-binding protein